MLAVMIPLTILSQFYRSSTGVIGPNLMADLHLTAEGLGIVTSMFFLVFTLLQLPAGVLLDRFGARRVMTAMLGLALVGTIWFAAADDLAGLTIGRGLIGAGFTSIMVGSLVICSRWFPADRFTTAMAYLYAFANAGHLLATGPLAAAAFALGWRASFVGLALITAALAALFFFVVRDAPPGHAYHQREPETLAATASGIGEVFRVRDALFLMPLIAVGYATVVTLLGGWGGPYFHEVHGLGEVARGEALAVMALAMIAGTICYGPLDRWFDTRKGVVLVGGSLTAAVLVVLALWPGPATWVAVLLLTLFCFFGGYSLVAMSHALSLYPERLSGRAVTTLNMVLMAGASLLPAAAGLIVGAFPDRQGEAGDLAYRLLFAALAAVTLAALAVYGRARNLRPSEAAGK